ncbi:MAG TPA: sugar ABC transporter permease, partial [Bacteroidota bacterium]
GAGPWKQFLNITIPMLAPTTVFVVMITVIGYFQLFAEPYVMTDGGPMNSTMSVVMMMYEQGFRWWNMGYAAAIAFVLFVIIMLFTLLQFAIQRRAEA